MQTHISSGLTSPKKLVEKIAPEKSNEWKAEPSVSFLYGTLAVAAVEPIIPNKKQTGPQQIIDRMDAILGLNNKGQSSVAVGIGRKDGAYTAFSNIDYGDGSSDFINVGKPKHFNPPENKTAKRQPISKAIFTSSCLFDNGVAGHSKNGTIPITSTVDMKEIGKYKGTKITNITIPKEFTPSEMISAITRNNTIAHIPGVHAISYYSMPRVNYLLYGRQLMEYGIMDDAAFQDWVMIVDARQAKVCDLEKALNSAVIFGDVLPYFQLAADTSVTLNDFKQQLSADEWWKIKLGDNPDWNWLDINYASYYKDYYNFIQSLPLETEQVIMVENHTETQIYERFADDVKQMAKFDITPTKVEMEMNVIYTLSKALHISDDGKMGNLYRSPSPDNKKALEESMNIARETTVSKIYESANAKVGR